MKDLLNHTIECSTPDQTLGSLITHFPLSKEEKDRINQRIAEKGLPREIIEKHAAQSKLFRDEFVKVSIPGFRPVKGQKSLGPQTLKAFCDFLKNPRERPHTLCWHIYRQSVGWFVKTELKSLQKLLEECEYVDENVSSHELLQNICSNAYEFGVKEQDVEKLYECVWLERIDDLAELLPLCKKANPASVLAKQLRDIASSIDALKHSFNQFEIEEKKRESDVIAIRESISEKLATLFASQKSHAEKLKDVTESSLKNLEAHDKSIRELVSDQNLNYTLEKSFVEFKKFVDNRLVQNHGERLRGLEANLEAQTNHISDITSAIQAQLSTIENDLLSLSTKNDPTILESIQKVIEEKLAPFLSRQDMLEETVQKIGRTTGQSTVASTQFRSPLALPTATGKLIPNVAKEADFLRYWGQYLQRHNKVFLIEQLVAFHCSFLANNVVIADYELSASWIHCLGWDRFSMDLVASPAWCEEQDWKDGILHLFASKAGETRLLSLHNYDVGLVDCYLTPTVHLWALKKESFSQFCKLFLIPADSIVPQTSNVLNHVSVTINESSDEWAKLELIKDFGRDFPKTSLQTCVVDPVSVAHWIAASDAYEPVFQNLTTAIKDKLEIKIDPWIKELSSKTIGECARYFDERSAIYVGLVTHVLPWIRHKYGQDDYEIVKKYSLQILDLES